MKVQPPSEGGRFSYMDFEVSALALLGGDVAGDGVDDVSEEPSSDVDFEAAALAILGGDVAGDGGGDDPEAAALAGAGDDVASDGADLC